MALIHHTTIKPTKLELLTSWLPGRPGYVGDPAAAPLLTKAGGFRLDDPEGEVGIEFMVTTDTAGTAPVHCLTPFTYRGAPLPEAEHALVGTVEHGVLGTRWVYDGVHDPVLIAQLLALFEGRADKGPVHGALDTAGRHPGPRGLRRAAVIPRQSPRKIT